MKLKQKLTIGYIRTKFRLLSLVSKRKAAEQAFALFCTPFSSNPKRKPTIFKWAEEIRFRMDGMIIRGYRWNHKRPKKILILHGFGSAAYKFNAYIEPLLQKGYEVIAFDAPAHASSTGKTVNAIQYSNMIAQVMRRYGPIDGFIAHSFGGLALSLTLEKIKHDEETKVVLIAPATETTTAIDQAFYKLRLDDAAVRKELEMVIIEVSGQHPKWFSINRAMKNINAEVLWFHDEEDKITPLADALKTKEKNLPNVEFVITKGLGHKRIYSDETVKKRAVDFL